MSNNRLQHEVSLAALTLERALGTGAKAEVTRLDPQSGEAEVRVNLSTASEPSSYSLRLVIWHSGIASPPDPNVVWVLPRSPKHAARTLSVHGANFIDPFRGQVRIHAPGFVVDRTGVRLRPHMRSDGRHANPFGDRASLVSRVLASEPGRIWGTRELAEVAGVSTMTASHAVHDLASANVVLVEPAGRAKRICLRSVKSLIAAWASYYTWTANSWTTYAAPIGDLQRFLRRLPRELLGHRWALTMHSAASFVAPLATWNKVHIYVDASDQEQLWSIAHKLGWSEAADGNLVVARPFYRQSVWFGMRTITEVPVVADVQIILDLWEYPNRGREQAQHLLRSLPAESDIGS